MIRLRTAVHLALLVAGFVLLLITPSPAAAHGGGIDAYGGHNDTKRGNYHTHQGTCAGRMFNSKADAIKAGCKR